MEQASRKSLRYYMRSLHRDVGFFLIGLTIIYALSGIFLIYRDADFLKQEVIVEKKLKPNLSEFRLGKALKKKKLKVFSVQDNVVYFDNGSYNQTSGVAKYKKKVHPVWIQKLTKLHKSGSKKVASWFTTIYAVLLLFLAISAFWMFPPHSKKFQRGMWLTGTGVIATVALLLL